MITTADRRILNKLKTYEGQTVGAFMYSDLVEFIGVDIVKINGQGVGYGEEYNADESAIIDYIQVRNVSGYIIADITTRGAQ